MSALVGAHPCGARGRGALVHEDAADGEARAVVPEQRLLVARERERRALETLLGQLFALGTQAVLVTCARKCCGQQSPQGRKVDGGGTHHRRGYILLPIQLRRWNLPSIWCQMAHMAKPWSHVDPSWRCWCL